MPYDYDDDVTTDPTAVKKTWVASVIAVLVVLVLALGGWLMFSKSNTAVSTKTSIEETIKSGAEKGMSESKKLEEKIKDAAAEVPQAASDAATKGDQDTTRPNKDGSKNKLDQKP